MTKRQRLDRELARYELYFLGQNIEAKPHTYERLRLPEESGKLLELARFKMNRIKPVPPRMDENFFEEIAFTRGALRYAGAITLDDMLHSTGVRRRTKPHDSSKLRIRSLRGEKFSDPRRQVYDASMWCRSMQSKPRTDALRDSEILTAADFAVTINCRG